MKLTFKDLRQTKFVVEAEPSDTILSVKEKIEAEKGWKAAEQKLIYSGKILQNDHTVESYSIEEKGFIVCMVTKAKAAPEAASTSKTPSTPAKEIASTPAPPAAPAPSTTTTTSAVPATPSPAGSGAAPQAIPSTPASSGPGTSGLSMGSERAAQIAEMESMGFPRTEIDAAMRAAFYNSERAIEYLLTGIPENLQQEARNAAPAAQGEAAATPVATGGDATVEGGEEGINLFEAAAQAGSGRGASAGRGAAGAGGAASLLAGAGLGAGANAAGGLGNLDFLRNNPQFQQLRQVVQQNPQMLEPILQQVGAGNPQLAQLIGQNPDQFLQLLSEDADNDSPLPPGAQAISVTEEERAAIERLTLLGFSRDLAIQAYFACDKNEELAANFLFEQPDDDDMQQ